MTSSFRANLNFTVVERTFNDCEGRRPALKDSLCDPAWVGQLWLTSTLYHGHTLHLYVQAELPYVLWQAPNGDWRLLTTPAELRQLAAIRPIGAAMRAMLLKHGLVDQSLAIGTLLPRAAASPQQLG